MQHEADRARDMGGAATAIAPCREMTIGNLIACLPHAILDGDPLTPITDIAFDSRWAGPGSLFVALCGGYVDGHRFLPAARDAGAVAALVEPDTPGELLDGYAAIVPAPDTRAALARVAARWFDHPSRALTLIGVTGTDGKTTTCHLIDSLARESGRSSGLVSTVAIHSAGRPLRRASGRTTPESLDVQRCLARMRDDGVEIAVLETTSHGLETHRVDGCLYDIGVLTNVTHEHLDFHGTLAGYRDAKAGLLRRVVAAHADGKRGLCVLNRDDAGTRSIAGAAVGADVLWYSAAGNQPADIRADAIEAHAGGCRFDLRTPAGMARVNLRLPGRWNVANALAAAAVGHALEMTPEGIAAGLGAVESVPGRMERVDAGQPFTVIVDYAHTPAALRMVLSEVRRLTRGRVLVLIGSAGEADVAKRPLLGAVAGELAELAVFASDDPRYEDPYAIIAAIASGAAREGGVEGSDFLCIEDRRTAIHELIARARPGDVVVLAGKGHERTQLYGETPHPWSDAAVARDALTL
ncbi:MAG TPA: UDP-N-acetylmuramoyl-L-alanyl-D-glutamate--2,6-diaminopimelate ligase [Thermomicrobiales bacterium]|nr:UDP-N-acetylmuramoyl-L-alanyl-D-glutamate--2,6-diaminopimelate ligase [Thermomicrobiales bacterium]